MTPCDVIRTLRERHKDTDAKDAVIQLEEESRIYTRIRGEYK